MTDRLTTDTLRYLGHDPELDESDDQAADHADEDTPTLRRDLIIAPEDHRRRHAFAPLWPWGAIGHITDQGTGRVTVEWMRVEHVRELPDRTGWMVAARRDTDTAVSLFAVDANGIASDCRPWTEMLDNRFAAQHAMRNTPTFGAFDRAMIDAATMDALPEHQAWGYRTTAQGPRTPRNYVAALNMCVVVAPRKHRRQTAVAPHWPHGAVATITEGEGKQTILWRRIITATPTADGWSLVVSHQDGTDSETVSVGHDGSSDACEPWDDELDSLLGRAQPWPPGTALHVAGSPSRDLTLAERRAAVEARGSHNTTSNHEGETR